MDLLLLLVPYEIPEINGKIQPMVVSKEHIETTSVPYKEKKGNI